MTTENGNQLIEIQDADLLKFGKRYCQHTGKPIGEITATQLQEIVQIHGKDAARVILRETQKGYAPEWIWQNSEGLANLANWQPKEYLVYVIATLMGRVGCGKTASNMRRSGSNFANGSENWQWENRYGRFRFGLAGEIEGESESFADCSLAERVWAWRNLQDVPDDVIKPVAEVCRRIVGKVKPVLLEKVLAKCECSRIYEITSSLAGLMKFQNEMEKLLKWLIDGKGLQALDKEHKAGLSNFAKQGMITGLSQLEQDIMREMNDFELIPELSAKQIEELQGRKRIEPAKKKKSGQAFHVVRGKLIKTTEQNAKGSKKAVSRADVNHLLQMVEKVQTSEFAKHELNGYGESKPSFAFLNSLAKKEGDDNAE